MEALRSAMGVERGRDGRVRAMEGLRVDLRVSVTGGREVVLVEGLGAVLVAAVGVVREEMASGIEGCGGEESLGSVY
jgi:hypothetical protein